ncbi:diflavin oxidoreductase [Terriglobus roseus]|uniref:assimilatory sulfite reductase (NADPH) n=1 Tax=Terriglobus roseus TaxID=392734 RepID=A0A1G7JF69_9BACT|nr:flavodoxin domain-containing protein [Terriglobus roseus]SDF23551.1 NAD(P)H-dependent nitrite reductase flavoprotein subunit [Terriglobus roseus]
MKVVTPFIPEDAPFSAEQRAWLNKLLADLFPKPLSTEPPVSFRVSVYFASQSGTAERLAKKMSKLLKEAGHAPKVQSVESLSLSALAQETYALFFASTYGDGEPPENACVFRDALFSDNAPRLQALRYAVFCLGDRAYEHFCQFGIELDDRLNSLGASRITARVESDLDVDTAFSAWSSQFLKAFCDFGPKSSEAAQVTTSPAAANLTHTRENPYHAPLVDKRLLTHPSSSKQTVHVGFDLTDAELQYEAGDACGVLAENDPALVDEILELLSFSPSDTAILPKSGPLTVEQLLRHHLQITKLTRKVVQRFAEKAECQTLSTLLIAETGELETYLYGRGLIDLLHAYPGVLSNAAELVELLPRLTPRLYSISSSPTAHGRELHCTIGVVNYTAHGRDRGGVASTMLGQRMEIGARVPIYLHPNKRFRLPKNSEAPIIMIGPGTGVAPFRAFLHERRALGHTGKNWLFFGERSAETDFLYCCEMKSFVDDGHLTRFDTAFSRDQAHKVYVQDRMLESGAELFRWLNDGASLYVCGDASRMAKDVDVALHRIVSMHGNLTNEAAQEYVSALHDENRYHRDVY